MAERVSTTLARKGHAVWAAKPETTVYDALAILAEKDVGALLVIEDGELVGIFSERDYARKVALLGRSSKDLEVRDIMTTPVIMVSPDDAVEDCMRIMTEHRVRHLPVVDRGKLIGVVSIGDLVNAIISEQADTIEHLSNYIRRA